MRAVLFKLRTRLEELVEVTNHHPAPGRRRRDRRRHVAGLLAPRRLLPARAAAVEDGVGGVGHVGAAAAAAAFWI